MPAKGGNVQAGIGNSCCQDPTFTQKAGLNGWRDKGAGADDVRIRLKDGWEEVDARKSRIS